MLNPSSGADVSVALEPDPQGGDGAADIGLRFGGLYAEGMLWGRTLRDAGGLQPARGAVQAP